MATNDPPQAGPDPRSAGTPRALLLSGSIGLGHTMMARACAEVLQDEWGWRTETRDSMNLLGGWGADVSNRVSQRLMRTRGVHDALHFAHLRTGSRLALGLARSSDARVVPALARELDRSPADLLLSVFATGAAAAAALKPRAPGRPTVVLCTDACAHRLWVWPGTDLFLVTSQAAAESVRRFQPRAQIRVVPPPVRAEFRSAVPDADARAVLDVPSGEPCVLMLDSGWGFGARVEAARRLADAGVHVLAVAGRGAGAGAAWEALTRDRPRVRAYGRSDQVALLMAASDLVVALPGATTCGEARALGKPLMLLDLMPGHGRENLQQQLDLGSAYVCDASATGMSERILAAVEDGLPSTPRQDPRAWPDALTGALHELGLRPGEGVAAAPAARH